MIFKQRHRCESNEEYYRFLDVCREKYKKQLQVDVESVPLESEEQSTRVYWQKHHIIPTFIIRDYLKKNQVTLTPAEVQEVLTFRPLRGQPELRSGQESPENVIILTEEDHIFAHQIMAKIYGDPRDKGAVQLLLGGLADARTEWRRAGAAATHAKLKAAGANFWDSEVQKANAIKSASKPDAFETRSQGGKLGGRNRNLGVAITTKDRYLVFYENKPVFCVFNCETGGDVIKQLQAFKKTPIERVTPLLKGSRSSAYNWKLELIREQA